MARMKLLLIVVVLAVSVHAEHEDRPRYNYFRVPLPPVPIFGHPLSNIHLPALIPTLETITNTIPTPGQVFNGVFTKTTSNLVRDKDGKWVPSGGTYAFINNNGKTKEYGHFQG